MHTENASIIFFVLPTEISCYIMASPYIKHGGNNMKYICSICGYVYDEELGDPENGIEPGTKWDELSDDFACPLCGAGKEAFEEVDE